MLVTLGCGEDAESPTAPESPPALSTAAAGTLSFRQISAGTHHTCGLTTDGSAYCWGLNGSGQLGDGTFEFRRLKPFAVSGGHRFVLISAGDRHTCAITEENRAYCWGLGNSGQLGDGTRSSRSTPGVIPGFRFRQIRVGFLHTCAITPTDVAFCWGNNDGGQLGNGGGHTDRPARVARGLRWIQVIAGASHSCGVTTDHRAWCWGANNFGQLGDGTKTIRRKPALVAGGLSFRQVVPGGGFFVDFTDFDPDPAHTCGVTTGDKAYCWGSGGGVLWAGELGATSSVPVKIAGGRSFRVLNTGTSHACGVTLSDAAFCWGSNAGGQLGVGSGTTRSTTPVRVSGGLQLNAVSAGTLGAHNCSWTTTDRRAYCWGRNDDGQLGDGTQTDRPTPVAVSGP
jgi:alpha-tubulin suppressor-like RCC1 family protein